LEEQDEKTLYAIDVWNSMRTSLFNHKISKKLLAWSQTFHKYSQRFVQFLPLLDHGEAKWIWFLVNDERISPKSSIERHQINHKSNYIKPWISCRWGDQQVQIIEQHQDWWSQWKTTYQQGRLYLFAIGNPSKTI
jgi:hypothetical protein